ncbi:MAG: DUF4474 domain-containing protein [Oscillospiraceae bacterium]|nr:DUF4474 domain-containing protein [Oscillospiraceae bacterium]
MGGLIYLIGSPLFWGLFILAAIIGAILSKIFGRRPILKPTRPPVAPGPPIAPIAPPSPPVYPGPMPEYPPASKKNDSLDLSGPSSDEDEIRQLLSDFGYGFDPSQNVFFSLVNAWQRRYGYCLLYDEGTAPSGMIIDSEPIYFNYRGEQFMIELWKGQYGMTTGCEVGFYRDSGKALLGAPWFQSVEDNEMLDIAATLYRDGAPLFTRREYQWWLTGFVLGMFSQPHQLALLVTIVFPDCEMACAFLKSAYMIGYTEQEAYIRGTAVTIWFTTPKTAQPSTRTKLLEDFTQAKNKLLCDTFTSMVGGDTNMYSILARAKEQYPDVYDSAMSIGRSLEPLSRFTSELPGLS